MAVLLITHDLGVVAETADHVAVMYAGQVVEYCDVRSAFQRTRHPYTAGLLASLPKLGGVSRPCGSSPAMCRIPCVSPRAVASIPAVRSRRTAAGRLPVLRTIEEGHLVRCHRAEEIAAGTVDAVTGEGRSR